MKTTSSLQKSVKLHLTSISGQGLSEYLILVVLIAMGSIAVTTKVGKAAIEKMELINRKLQNDVTLEAVNSK